MKLEWWSWFTHKLLLTDTKVSKNRKAFEKGSSVNINFSETPLSKIVQLGGFLTGMTGIVNPENEIFKTVNRLVSLAKSVAKQSASMGNKGAVVNAIQDLVYSVKWFKRKFID